MLRIRKFFLIQNRMKVFLHQRRDNGIYLGMFKVVRFTDDCFLLHVAFPVFDVMLNTHVDHFQLSDPSLFSQ